MNEDPVLRAVVEAIHEVSPPDRLPNVDAVRLLQALGRRGYVVAPIPAVNPFLLPNMEPSR